MEKINYDAIEIVKMYLLKLEDMNEEERRVLIKSIDLINNPFFCNK